MGKRFIAFIASAMIAVFSFAQESTPHLFISADTVNSDGTVQVPVVLAGAQQICAFQFSVLLPDSIALDADGSVTVTGGDLFTDHIIDYNLESDMEDEFLNVACLSPTNSVFAADSGAVCFINLKFENEIAMEKILIFFDVELSTPSVEGINTGLEVFTVFPREQKNNPDTIPVFVPDISFGISPFAFQGTLQSAITIQSNMDISSLSFQVTVPENLAVNKLISLFGKLLSTQFRTEIMQTDVNKYGVSIAAIDDSLITAGLTAVTGISVDFVIGLITPGQYDFVIDDIQVTAPDGKIYEIPTQYYSINVTPTLIGSVQADALDEPVGYFTIDGREVPGPVKGITLIRHADGRVTKLINR